MKNRITDLRNHLFETLEELRDKENPLDIARAKTISDVAQTILNSAKVELHALDLMGRDIGVAFFDQPLLPRQSQQAGSNPQAPPGPAKPAPALAGGALH